MVPSKMRRKKPEICKKCKWSYPQGVTATGLCNTCMDLELRPLTKAELEQYQEMHTRIEKHAQLLAQGQLCEFEVRQGEVVIYDNGHFREWAYAPHHCHVPVDIFLDDPQKTKDFRTEKNKVGAQKAFEDNQAYAKRLREEQAKKDKEQARETMKKLIEKYPDVWEALA